MKGLIEKNDLKQGAWNLRTICQQNSLAGHTIVFSCAIGLSVNVVFLCLLFCLHFQNDHLCSKVLILHTFLSCSANFPVLYKINKIMPLVSSSLTSIHCDLSTVGYGKHFQVFSGTFLLGLFQYPMIYSLL